MFAVTNTKVQFRVFSCILFSVCSWSTHHACSEGLQVASTTSHALAWFAVVFAFDGGGGERANHLSALSAQGTYDAAEDMTVNTAIGSPLLSRFDLVLLLLDTKNKVGESCGLTRDGIIVLGLTDP